MTLFLTYEYSQVQSVLSWPSKKAKGVHIHSTLEGNVNLVHISLIYHICSVLSFLLMNPKIGFNKINPWVSSINTLKHKQN